MGEQGRKEGVDVPVDDGPGQWHAGAGGVLALPSRMELISGGRYLAVNKCNCQGAISGVSVNKWTKQYLS